jgi:hypothetical protein
MNRYVNGTLRNGPLQGQDLPETTTVLSPYPIPYATDPVRPEPIYPPEYAEPRSEDDILWGPVDLTDPRANFLMWMVMQMPKGDLPGEAP